MAAEGGGLPLLTNSEIDALAWQFLNSVASPSQAAAAASIDPGPGPEYMRPELISGGNPPKSSITSS